MCERSISSTIFIFSCTSIDRYSDLGVAFFKALYPPIILQLLSIADGKLKIIFIHPEAGSRQKSLLFFFLELFILIDKDNPLDKCLYLLSNRK